MGAMIQPALSSSLTDAACVAANRRGEIAPAQRDAVNRFARFWGQMSRMMFAMMFVVGALAQNSGC